MKLNALLTSVRSLFGSSYLEEPHAKQKGIQADMIRLLMRENSITARDILRHTNDAGKMLTRMRRLGVLKPAGDPAGFEWVPNASGVGQHMRYFWTKHVPAGFTAPEERRTRKRGGQ